MKKLLNRGYQATVKRGCITNETTCIDFIDKIAEEIQEVYDAYENDEIENHILEVGDVIQTSINYLIWLGKDPIEILKKIVKKKRTKSINRRTDKVEIVPEKNR